MWFWLLLAVVYLYLFTDFLDYPAKVVKTALGIQNFKDGSLAVMTCPGVEVSIPENALTPEYGDSIEYFGAARVHKRARARKHHGEAEKVGAVEKLSLRKPGSATTYSRKRIVWKK